MRRLKPEELIRVTHPFAVFVAPAPDVPGTWIAHLVGHELDNVTQGDGPVGALAMAADIVKILTGFCCEGSPEHDWSVDTILSSGEGFGVDRVERIPAWGCSRCDERAAKTCFEELP